MSRRTMRTGATGSPFVRHWLAIGVPPPGRVKGWVATMETGGEDNMSMLELIAKYGDALRRECAAAGFVPRCDQPLRQQSAEAQAAAQRWAAAVIAEGRY